jgi:DNA-directed RNA polymerase subunit F
MERTPPLDEIRSKIKMAKTELKRVGYAAMDVSPQEFFDYMTGEIFSEDPTTLRDVLGNEYIMIHELVEISELKKVGRTIDKRVIVDSPKTTIYTAHFAAIEAELSYALQEGDTYWARWRLKTHKTSVLDADPNLPEEMRPRAEEIFKRFSKLIETYT